MSDGHPISLKCDPVAGGWRCIVTVGDDPGATTHRVLISQADLGRVGPPGTTAERLAQESFAFLLEHEPREAILREFDLPVIGRYFSEYEGEIRRRLGG